MRSFILVALLGILFSISTQQNCSASLTFSFNTTIAQNDFGGLAVGSNYQFSFTTASNFTSTGQSANFGLYVDQPGNLVFTNFSGTGLTGAISESSLDGMVGSRLNQTGFAVSFVADNASDMGFSFQGTPLFFFNIGFTGSGIVNPFVPGATLENTFNTGTFLNTGNLTTGDAGITALGGGLVFTAEVNSVTITSSSPTAVPEPTSIFLATGVSTLWFFKRRKKNSDSSSNGKAST